LIPFATSQGGALHDVWIVFIRAGIVVYVIVVGLILFAAVRYRRRNPNVIQGKPFFSNIPLEITWTVIPLLMVGGLFAVSNPAEYHVETVRNPADEVVDVVAYRWSWRFLYPKEHVAVEGSAHHTPELVLPLERTTEIRLTSSDVIHAFWVPAFLFKRDAIPGRTNVFDLTPIHAGTFRGACAEFCGTFHAYMPFSVRVVPAAEYASALQAASRPVP
jgi:cytochrome c oxidase subunit 2